MLFREKNNGGIELHLISEERELIYRALRRYSLRAMKRKCLREHPSCVFEMMKVLELPEYKEYENGI